jgi:alkylglycerol monooxygenase
MATPEKSAYTQVNMGSFFIAAAIPLFFIAIGIELWVAHRRGLRLYRFEDTVTDLACGVSSQISAVFFQPFLLAAMASLFSQFSIWQFDANSIATWFIAFIGVDFAYYWWHRLSHEVNFLWAAHVVHHQSEEYNLSVALRQAFFTQFTSFPFYAPLALIGIPPSVLGITVALSTLYQFWIHTELVDRLPRFEVLFNAPMHHRVHHAINPKYLDKNYAATLIIWDKLFGTYIEETEQPVYGTVKPIQKYDAIWANLEVWASLWSRAKKAPTLTEGIRLFLMKPEWTLSNEPAHHAPEVSRNTFKKYDKPVSRKIALWIAAQMALASLVLVYLLAHPELDSPIKWGAGLLVLWTLFDFAGRIEQRKWTPMSEALRWTVIGIALLQLASSFVG